LPRSNLIFIFVNSRFTRVLWHDRDMEFIVDERNYHVVVKRDQV